MQFKTLLSIYITIAGAAAAATTQPRDVISQFPECAKTKLVDAMVATGCTSVTDAACLCPNAKLQKAVEKVVSKTEVCPSADDRKLIASLWNENCPDEAITAV